MQQNGNPGLSTYFYEVRYMKKLKKITLSAAALFIFIAALCAGMFIYQAECRKHDVDTAESPNGLYRLELQQVGEPKWPFGSTKGRVLFISDETTVYKQTFTVQDDGANLSEYNWSVEWNTDSVSVTLWGSEQEPEEIVFQYP